MAVITGQTCAGPAPRKVIKTDPVTWMVQRYFDRVLAAMVDNGELAAGVCPGAEHATAAHDPLSPAHCWQVLRAKSSADSANSAQKPTRPR